MFSHLQLGLIGKMLPRWRRLHADHWLRVVADVAAAAAACRRVHVDNNASA